MKTPTGWARRAALAASVAVGAALLLAPPATGTARAQGSATEQARDHFARGKQLFATGEYRGAIGEFAAADKLAPSPLLEFNIALCHERLGERAEAVRRYKHYLERVPDASNRTAVEAKVGQLEAELKAESQSKSAAAPPVLVPPPVGGEAGAPEGAGEAAPTGDPELDRAAKIDIGKLRAQRASRLPPPDRRAAGGPPPPPDSAGPSAPPAAPKDQGENKEKPVYKQWWFWVVAGAAVVVVGVIAFSGSDSTSRSDRGNARILPFGDGARGTTADPGGGAVLLRF
ncbi:MAG TPA: hypothetical protein VKB80_17230 [Kofleriaceae bacterium]|nr:hypothetical protein [Kofleriaceae bacterium]